MKIPIFQLTYCLDEEQKPGLCFPSEAKETSNPSLVFGIPVLLGYDAYWGLPAYLQENQFYFPVNINGRYAEVTASLEFPNLVFNLPGLIQQITFEMDLPQFFPPPNITKDQLYQIYKGGQLTFRNLRFITLSAVSILAMDDLYLTNHIVFVGYTPNYGEINREYFNSQA